MVSVLLDPVLKDESFIGLREISKTLTSL